MTTLIWVGFSISLFAGFVIISKPNRSNPDKVLSIWLLFIAIDFLIRAIEYFKFDQALLSNSFLLLNPLIFLYTQSLTKSNFRFKWTQLLHLAPFIFLEIFVHTMEEEMSLSALINQQIKTFPLIIFIGISTLSWLFYNSKSYFLLKDHTFKLMNEFSNIDRDKNISWLRFVLLLYVLYSLIIFVLGGYFTINNIDSSTLVFIVSASWLFLVGLISYNGIFQERIFPTLEEESEDKAIPLPLSLDTNTESIIKSIYKYFEEEKPYLNPSFNMESFSNALNIPKHQLTWILNHSIGKNFFQFVNEFRVEEVKIQLLNKKNIYSIEAIGYDCGFNSKSSFFTIFKKVTGLTPLEFKKKHLNS